MIVYFCDVCGERVCSEGAVVDEKELTIDTGDTRLSILVQVSSFSRGKDERAAICASCLSKRFSKWMQEVADEH
jgi:hypothetical protein